MVGNGNYFSFRHKPTKNFTKTQTNCNYINNVSLMLSKFKNPVALTDMSTKGKKGLIHA